MPFIHFFISTITSSDVAQVVLPTPDQNYPPSPSGVNRVTEDGQLRVTETNEQLITV